MVKLYHFSITCQDSFSIFLNYSKTSPIEKRKFDRYQPELRNPVAIPLIVVWINLSSSEDSSPRRWRLINSN